MPFQPRPCFSWRLLTRTLELGRTTCIMGILNLTPDSFSDGGRFQTTAEATDAGLSMLDHGAGLLDLGGESTRPNAVPVSPEEEQARVLPVLSGILKARPEAILSIDTYHAATARRAIDAGAEIVNDVSGFLWDPAMASTCASLACGVVLMHTRGRPAEWSSLPPLDPGKVTPLVVAELAARTRTALAAGVDRTALALDPGFGFGKLGAANYGLLAHLEELGALGFPMLAGVSRKGFLAQTVASLHRGDPPLPAECLSPTLAAQTATLLAGAHILRVHDVQPALEAAAIADAIRGAG